MLRPRLKSWPALTLFFLLGLWSATTTCTGRAILQARERSVPRIRIEDSPQADAVAVLSGDGAPRRRPLYPHESPNRSETGLALYRAGRAEYLVFTAGGPEGWRNRSGAIAEGVPPERVLVVGPAGNTAAEARLIAETAKRRGWRRLILVTSGFHMARAKLLLEGAAAKQDVPLHVFPYAADSGTFFYKDPGVTDYLPSFGGFERSSRTAKEIVGEWACLAGLC